jgi:hypothetical protein
MKQAKVAKVIDEFKVVLNVGTDDGIEANQDFIIYRQGDDITDPDTGESLGTFEEVIGRGVITYVQDRIATLESSDILEGGRKVVRKANRFTGIIGMFSPDTEEVFEMPDKTKPFKNARIGDLVKRM